MEAEQQNPQLAAVHTILETQIKRMATDDNARDISDYNTAIANWNQQELQAPGANPRPSPPMLRSVTVSSYWPFTVSYAFSPYKPPPDPAMIKPPTAAPAFPVDLTRSYGMWQGSLGPIVEWFYASAGDGSPDLAEATNETGHYKKHIFVSENPFTPGQLHYTRYGSVWGLG